MIHNAQNDDWFLEQARQGILKVSKSGAVLNTVTGNKIGALGSGGYIKISMLDQEEGKIRHMQVHRLVWLVYKGKIPQHLMLNHKNTVKTANQVTNLELVTNSQNMKHAHRNGLVPVHRGQDRPNAAFSDALVCRLRKKYARAQGRLVAYHGACKYGVSAVTFYHMLRGKTYSHLVTGYEQECNRLLQVRPTIAPSVIKDIKRLHSQGLSVYKISSILGIARNTVMKYW